MFTGSISVNRITVGLPPPLRQELMDESRHMGMKIPEYIRHILMTWSKERKDGK